MMKVLRMACVILMEMARWLVVLHMLLRRERRDRKLDISFSLLYCCVCLYYC